LDEIFQTKAPSNDNLNKQRSIQLLFTHSPYLWILLFDNAFVLCKCTQQQRLKAHNTQEACVSSLFLLLLFFQLTRLARLFLEAGRVGSDVSERVSQKRQTSKCFISKNRDRPTLIRFKRLAAPKNKIQNRATKSRPTTATNLF
jgi:hypothetical protein